MDARTGKDPMLEILLIVCLGAIGLALLLGAGAFGLMVWTAKGESDMNGDIERDAGGGTNTFPWASILHDLKPTREADRLKREGKLQPHPTKCKKIG